MASMEETTDLSPPLLTEWPKTVHEIQVALHDKLTGYKGGIKGVWRQIDKKYKSEGGGKPGITEAAFTRAVTRLMNKSPHNEDMFFGIRGNIILLMHVLEIIGIKEFSRIIEAGTRKPDTSAVIHDTNIRVEEIQKKLDEIIEAVEMSNKRTSRFPVIKVCRDWEAVLISVNNMKNFTDKGSELYGFNNWLIGGFDTNIRLVYYFYNILKSYSEYFSRDTLLHNFYKNLGGQLVNNYTSPSVIYLPLYILYFTLTVHRKFLSVVLNKIDYDPFINISMNETGQIIKNKGLDVITESDCGRYILKQNDDILRYIKNILTLINKNNIINTGVDFSLFFKETVNILFEIYSIRTDSSHESMARLMESIKSIEDLYSKMSLGEPHFYYITKEIIDKLYNVKEGLEQKLDFLERLGI
jgi:hypothetical protein